MLISLMTIPAARRVSAASNSEVYAQPHWFAQLTDYGYSDFLIFPMAPFPTDALHEMLSGEWGAAIWYDGLPSAMWLEPWFLYPDWMTNSTFTVVTPISFPSDTDGDGINEGSSKITNGTVEIEIVYDFEDTGTGTPMGMRGGNYTLSDRYVLYQTYNIKNMTAATLTNVRLFQFMHPHPANTEIPTVDMVFDTDMHADGSAQSYSDDITAFAENTGMTDGSLTGSWFYDQVGFSSAGTSDDWGLGFYRGHFPGKPVCGLHCDVESDSLGNQLTFGPDEVAGAQRFSLGSLAPGATASVTVQLTVQSAATGTPAGSCLEIFNTGPDPFIQVAPGPCRSAGSPSPQYDVVMGSLSKLVEFSGLVFIQDVRCLAQAHATDRLDLPEDAHISDPLFILVRQSSQFNVWGMGSDSLCASPPCYRVSAIPVTSPGVDLCP